MKYIRYKKQDKQYTGILENNTIYRLGHETITDMIKKDNTGYRKNTQDEPENVEVLPPVNPTKIVCVGLNYHDHAKELDMKLPTEPLLFIKPSTAIIADKQNIIRPEESEQLDYEAELGIVIGEKITQKNYYKEAIAGYTIINDITARDLQQKDIQWTRAKSFDTFAPTGPVIRTNINPDNLEIKTYVNNKIKQNSNTKNMIFSPEKLVKYISDIMTLNPGDIIATGTPPGVGQLHAEDVVKIEIEKIGTLENTVK